MDNYITKYGWQHYCQQTEYSELNQIGRILTVNKTNYSIAGEQGIITGELTGQMLYSSESEDLPQTGDWVEIMPFDSQCIITNRLPRINYLARKLVGKTSEKQVIAANVDAAFIVQGLDRDFNPRRLHRMILALNDAKVEPIVVLNKSDLDSEAEQKVLLIKKDHPSIKVILISALKGIDLSKIEEQLESHKTYVLLGSSGAGKSTLLNALIGSDIQKTNIISDAVGKGKHTTTARELFVLPNGSLIIDTAGVREFGLALDSVESVALTFSDIDALSASCKYDDCAHVDEPECAVLAAIEDGTLDESIYQSYLKLKSEAEHYKATQQEKKQKGKDLARLVKDMKRQNIKKRYL